MCESNGNVERYHDPRHRHGRAAGGTLVHRLRSLILETVAMVATSRPRSACHPWTLLADDPMPDQLWDGLLADPRSTTGIADPAMPPLGNPATGAAPGVLTLRSRAS